MSGFHSGLTTCFIIMPTTYTNWLTKNKQRNKNNNAMKENKTNTQNEKTSQVRNSLKSQNKRWKTYQAWKGKLKVLHSKAWKKHLGLGGGNTNLAKPRHKTTNKVKQQEK